MDYLRANDHNNINKNMTKLKSARNRSLISFLKNEVTRDYLLENDEERFSAGRERFYSFMKIPKELEKFILYGMMHCVDSFLFVYTYFPLRVIIALWALLTKPFSKCFGSITQRNRQILNPAQFCDLLKAVIFVACTVFLTFVDTNMIYHLIKSQSVIKLYIFYNMLHVGDKLLISWGQDTLDALLWTAAEPKGRKREHLGVIPHLILTVVYVIMHSILILFQATTLNVAMNASNKALLTIMMSNNFVELKGSVFKKVDKNNLFQVSCSDVRERFHLLILLTIVILQTMKGYQWKKIDILWSLLFDAVAVLIAEVFVDWIKHAFITRYNELNIEAYKDFRTSIAYDLTHNSPKDAFSGHSDVVARRMGFAAIPLGALFARVLFGSINLSNLAAIILFIIGFLCIWSWKVIFTILIFGKACSINSQYKLEKLQNLQVEKSSPTTSPQHLIVVNKQPRRVNFTNGIAAGATYTEKIEPDMSPSSDLGPSAIFTDSTVDLKNASLNEELLKENDNMMRYQDIIDEDIMYRSVPDIKNEFPDEDADSLSSGLKNEYENNLKKVKANQVW